MNFIGRTAKKLVLFNFVKFGNHTKLLQGMHKLIRIKDYPPKCLYLVWTEMEKTRDYSYSDHQVIEEIKELENKTEEELSSTIEEESYELPMPML